MLGHFEDAENVYLVMEFPEGGNLSFIQSELAYLDPRLTQLPSIKPLPRNKTNARTIGYPPCGGTPKGLSHTLAEPGSINPVGWSVRKASPLGNCTIRLSHGTDFSSFETLLPLGIDSSNGKFPCGRNETYLEKYSIEFPTGFTCGECTLQWTWETEAGNFYQCVDVQISKGSESSCFGRCKNGGACVNDECLCVNGFSGVYCQIEEVPVTPTNLLSLFLIFTLVFLILLIVAGATYAYVNKYRISRSAYLFFKRYQPWCLNNPNLDYWERHTGEINSPNMRKPVAPANQPAP